MIEPTAREMIPALLDRYRPDRYDPADKAWQDPVIEQVAFDISAAEARQMAATKLVSVAEATATRRTNALLREIAKTGEWPFEWFESMAWPLAVDDSERVAVRAAHPEDFRRFAGRERRAAARDFTSRNDACEGAEFVADFMFDHGYVLAAEIERTAAA